MIARWFTVIAVCSLPFEVWADLATVHLADGKSVTVELVSVEKGQVQWKNPASSIAQVQSYLRSEIDHVDFAPTGAWKNAEAAFQAGDMPSAITQYQEVVADPIQHFYDIPGNFVSLAQVRILDAHRAEMNSAAIAKQAEIVRGEFPNLPPEYRSVDPVIAAWIEVAKENWKGILDILEEVEQAGPETFYLRGLALESLGEWQDAVQQYAGAYVLNFGGSTKITRAALERSANLLAASGDESRRAELQAQAKIYRDLFGRGNLWPGAPAWVVELADAKISNAKTDVEETVLEKPEGNMEGAVATTTESEATLPPVEERDWLLASEIDRKVYVMNRTPEDPGIENLGGVKETENGYEFDGTGPGLKLSDIDGRKTMWVVKGIFVPQEKDGALFDLTDGKRGGFGFYLKAGKLVAVWKPLREKVTTVDVGEVTIGKPNTLYFRVSVAGDLRVRLDEQEPIDVKVDRRGLRIGAKLSASLGDTRSGEGDTFSADGSSYTPFKGRIEYFALGFGENNAELTEAERKQFGGKRITVRPPEDPIPEKPAAEALETPAPGAEVKEPVKPEE